MPVKYACQDSCIVQLQGRGRKDHKRHQHRSKTCHGRQRCWPGRYRHAVQLIILLPAGAYASSLQQAAENPEEDDDVELEQESHRAKTQTVLALRR